MDLDLFVNDLLHIDDGKNKLIDLGVGSDAFYLEHGKHETNRAYFLDLIKHRIGKPANTLLNGSSSDKAVVTADANAVDWRDMSGVADPAVLSKFIDNAYNDMSLRGVNTFFLCVGVATWKFKVGDKDRIGKTPLLLFPAVLTRFGKDKSIYLGILDEEIYVNPCFVAKLASMHGEEAAAGLPHPDGDVPKDDPIELENIGFGDTYFGKVAEYLAKFKYDDGTPLFDFDGNAVAVSRYSHDEICMYYDIRRNREKIESHPLIRSIFGESYSGSLDGDGNAEPMFVLPKDSVQTEMIKEVVNGKSVIIKGPPGSGKTLTIANMVAALMAEGKSILLASEKTAALSEVHAKLPEPLRKFAMLLDSETEKQAAKKSPIAVRKDFNDILSARKKHDKSIADGALTDMSHARRDITFAADSFQEHYDLMFGIPVVGRSYYDAVAAYCESDLPVVEFCDGKLAAVISDEQYRNCVGYVEKAGANFDRMSANGAHELRKCPWFPASGKLAVDTESAYNRNTEISKLAARVRKDGAANGFGDDLPFAQVLYVADSGLDDDALDAAVELDAGLISELSAALKEYEDSGAYNYKNIFEETSAGIADKSNDKFTGKQACVIVSRLASVETDAKLTGEQLKLIFENYDMLCRITCGGDKLKQIAEEYLKRIEDALKHKDAAQGFFRADLTPDDEKKIAAAAIKLAKFAERGASIGFMDKLAGQHAAKAMAKLSYLDNVEFEETVNATLEYNAYLEGIAGLDKYKQDLYRITRVRLTDEQVDVIIALGALCAGRDIKQLCETIKTEYATIVECATLAGMADDYTIERIRALCRAAIATDALVAVMARTGIAFNDLRAAAHGVFALRVICDCRSVRTAAADVKRTLIHGMLKLGVSVKGDLRSLKTEFAEFGKKHFVNYYCANIPSVTYADLAIFVEQATDRNIMNAAKEYAQYRDAECALPIADFFKPFEYGEKDHGDHPFAEWFKHSVFALAIGGYDTAIGEKRNGMGDRVKTALELRHRSEEISRNAAVDIIESKCLARINPADPAFAFLHEERSAAENVRRLFRNHGPAILKLKKCFLLSPSTVSVLLRGDEFNDFDVVIIDEASQSEPTGLLPALFRSKQCVLVGDEWQMPPIRHFTTVNAKTVVATDGETEVLDPSMSALGLALHNNAFPVRRLDCHYRSNTEALIAYSQALFYPEMHTFPAPVLVRDGLGFTDVYLPNGGAEGGVNQVEAQEVVRRLEMHFDKYYDETSGKLSESVGVIAFGIKQVDLIRRLVEKNFALREKIARAVENFEDEIKEKLIFYKTIETVQGQETKHTIISLTYGRNTDGKVGQTFGELNRNALGQCIFNVAVTRAQSSVTVIHSVEAEDITNANIKFIRDYLLYVRRYCGEHIREQFVSTDAPNAFIKSVGDYIISLGIAPERIAYGYGGTKGSVRIPIAVLDTELNDAQLGVWCETPHKLGDDYYDSNMGRFASLQARGWNFVRVYAHDWVDNVKATREAVAAAVEKYVKIG